MSQNMTGGDPKQTAKGIAKAIVRLARNHFSQGR